MATPYVEELPRALHRERYDVRSQAHVDDHPALSNGALTVCQSIATHDRRRLLTNRTPVVIPTEGLDNTIRQVNTK